MAAPPRRGSILPAATRDRMWKWIEHSIRSKGLCTLAGPIGCEGVGIRSQCFCTIAGPLAERAKPQGPLTRLWAPSDALPVGLLEASVGIARRSQVGVSRKRSLQKVHHHPTPTINPPLLPGSAPYLEPSTVAASQGQDPLLAQYSIKKVSGP